MFQYHSTHFPLTRWFLLGFLVVAFIPGFSSAKSNPSSQHSGITLDFSDVELPVLVRFISELTGKNFVLDEQVKGKISLYSPTKVTSGEAYSVFLSALELKGYKVVRKGTIHQIVRIVQAPPERRIFVAKLKNADVGQSAATLTGLAARSLTPKPLLPNQQPVTQGEEFESPVQVYSDVPTNSLIITATLRDYQRLKPIIESMDVRRHQVYVEGVILEVRVDRLRELGTDPTAVSVFNSSNVSGIFGINAEPVSTLAQIGAAFTGLDPGLVSLSNLNLRAFLKVLLTVTDANVLATPQLLTLDNVKARINVGSNVPFVTGSGTVGATGAILTTIVRQDVGVILEITPHLMEDDMIRLEVTQEITAVTNDPQVLGDDIAVGPTTRKRSATTTIMAKNGETVAMGGLIQEDSLFIRSKIPFLGDIPGLGWLFKSDSSQQSKLNLLLFLTPTIVKESSQMNRLVETNKSQSDLLKKEQLPEKDKPEIDW